MGGERRELGVSAHLPRWRVGLRMQSTLNLLLDARAATRWTRRWPGRILFKSACEMSKKRLAGPAIDHHRWPHGPRALIDCFRRSAARATAGGARIARVPGDWPPCYCALIALKASND